MKGSFPNRSFTYLLITSLLLISSTFQTGTAQGSGPEISHDAVEYAEAHGLTYEEALLRLSWQEHAVILDSELANEEEGSFAGLEIVHLPNFKVIVYTTDSSVESLRARVTGSAVVCVNQKRAHLIIENATTFGIESRL